MQIELPDTHAVATATPQTGPCLTQDTWKSISPSPVATLPNDLSHSLLLIERFDGGLLPNESLTYADGTLLADLGPGSWPDLSPDGAKVAYAYNGLRVFDVVSSQTSLLISEDTSYSMVWSPDGTRLALIRGADGVYLINADGTDLHRIPDSTADMIGIAGWLPDGKNLVVARIALGGTRIQTLNVDTGEIQDDFLIDNLKGGFTHLSPDGKRVMYSAAVFGEMNPGVYVANLNGSDVGLVAEPGSDFMFTSGAWSPDGQWLILNPYQVGAYHPEAQHPVVVNLNSCQVLILDGVLGEVRDWFWGGERSR